MMVTPHPSTCLSPPGCGAGRGRQQGRTSPGQPAKGHTAGGIPARSPRCWTRCRSQAPTWSRSPPARPRPFQFALRHPGPVNHPVVISGYWPGGPTAKAAPQANRLLVRSEFLMWALRTFARPVLARVAGVPKGFPLTAADVRTVTDLTGAIFPVVPRADGVIFDFFVSFPDVNQYDLEAVTVPTLIVHAADDPVAPYDAAQQAAGR